MLYKYTQNNTIHEILKAAETLYLDSMETNHSIRDIAKKAGYSYGTVYKYFKSIEELKNALFEFELRTVGKIVIDTVKNNTPEDYFLLAEAIVEALQNCSSTPPGLVITEFLRTETSQAQLNLFMAIFTELIDHLDSHLPPYLNIKLSQNDKILLCSLFVGFELAQQNGFSELIEKSRLIELVASIISKKK